MGLIFVHFIQLLCTFTKLQVPYHNWTHGWTVAHAMFVFLRHTKIFEPLEVGFLFKKPNFLLEKRKNQSSLPLIFLFLLVLGPLCRRHLSRFGSPRKKQRLHENDVYSIGCHLLNVRHGAPPFQSDGYYSSARRAQYIKVSFLKSLKNQFPGA